MADRLDAQSARAGLSRRQMLFAAAGGAAVVLPAAAEARAVGGPGARGAAAGGSAPGVAAGGVSGEGPVPGLAARGVPASGLAVEGASRADPAYGLAAGPASPGALAAGTVPGAQNGTPALAATRIPAATSPHRALAAGTRPGRPYAVRAPGPRESTADPAGGLPLVGGPDFPIGAFWPPPPSQITPERYQEVADAGFTFLVNGNYLWDPTGIRYALGIAEQAGLKMLVAGDPLEVALAANFWAEGDPTGYHPRIGPDDTATALRAILATYQGYPAFAGLGLVDEPAANRFGTLATLVAAVRELAPAALPYLNLRRLGQPYGPWGTPGMDAPTYATYLQQAVDTLAPALLSFDRYPFGTGGGEDPGYFQNWAIVRAAGLRAGIPTWIYVQSLRYAGHRLPTAAELAWQVNISLAYGAKGVQYFTYWTPDPSRGSGFVGAQGLLTVDGARTPLYDAARALNTGWLRPAGRELKALASESVVHAGEDPLPAGASGFTADERLAAVAGDPVVIGTFAVPGAGAGAGSGAAADPTRWLLVANRSYAAPATCRLTLRPGVRAARFAPAAAAYEALGGTPDVPLRLPAGGAALLRVTTG